jgi:Mrp family chromosome partitioning ATPase
MMYSVALERREIVKTVAQRSKGGECEWEETLSLDCTMYQDEKGFEEKLAKLSVLEIGEDKTETTVRCCCLGWVWGVGDSLLRCVGEVGMVSFDLKDYCDDSKEGLTNTVALTLNAGGVKKSTAGVQLAWVARRLTLLRWQGPST